MVGPETQYSKIEKATMVLITTSRKLRWYFLARTIIVRTHLPLKQILHRTDLAGILTKWFIEMFEFNIAYEAKKTLKGQQFVDFLVEMTLNEPESTHS